LRTPTSLPRLLDWAVDRLTLVNLGKHLGMFREKVYCEVRDGSEIVTRLFARLDEYADRTKSG